MLYSLYKCHFTATNRVFMPSKVFCFQLMWSTTEYTKQREYTKHRIHRNLAPLPWYKTKLFILPIHVSSIDMVNCNFLVMKSGLLYNLKSQRNYTGPLSLFSSLLERKDTNAVPTINADKKTQQITGFVFFPVNSLSWSRNKKLVLNL